ncbi:MAG TPA: hypothetical protein VGB63_13255 [Pedobacter sp.]|jgi:hypothetical protein
MKLYVGETVKKAVYDELQPVSITKIAKLVGLSRTRLYGILEEPEMEVKYILKLGKILNVDFSKKVKGYDEHVAELAKFEDIEVQYGTRKENEASDLLDLQRKYIAALEDIIRLKRELDKSKEEKKAG